MARVKNWHLDRYAVAYMEDGKEYWVETHYDEGRANHARDVLNEHEQRNQRPSDRYYVVPTDPPKI